MSDKKQNIKAIIFTIVAIIVSVLLTVFFDGWLYKGYEQRLIKTYDNLYTAFKSGFENTSDNGEYNYTRVNIVDVYVNHFGQKGVELDFYYDGDVDGILYIEDVLKQENISEYKIKAESRGSKTEYKNEIYSDKNKRLVYDGDQSEFINFSAIAMISLLVEVTVLMLIGITYKFIKGDDDTPNFMSFPFLVLITVITYGAGLIVALIWLNILKKIKKKREEKQKETN